MKVTPNMIEMLLMLVILLLTRESEEVDPAGDEFSAQVTQAMEENVLRILQKRKETRNQPKPN